MALQSTTASKTPEIATPIRDVGRVGQVPFWRSFLNARCRSSDLGTPGDDSWRLPVWLGEREQQ